MKKKITLLKKIFVYRFIIGLSVGFIYTSLVYSQEISVPPSVSKPAKGVNFFYLNGRDQEDLVQVAEKLYFGDDACKGTRSNIAPRFENSLIEIKAAGFEWVRLLVSKDFYEIYAPRCGFKVEEIYPALAEKHLAVLSELIERVAGHGLKIELVLSGTKWFADPKNDITFFQSILLGVPLQQVNMIILGGDVQPANAQYQADWLLQVLPYFLNHKRNDLASQNYLFDTVTYRDKKQASIYVEWVKKHFPQLNYLPINIYSRSLPPKSSWRDYSNEISEYVEIYKQAELPLWIDEYGFRLSNTSENTNYTEVDRVEYLKGFYHALSCKNTLPAAYFIWTAGNDRHLAAPNRDHDRTPFALFSGYEDEKPITTPAWNEVASFNTTPSYCEQFVETTQ
ncbi:hypothetical protein [uncultured Alteromonas sp.]|jgi:hypothetical protein|uniref:hypothetical protein n=1 Tax=uncultured Alteromonas sp. TaxID=179113 RepID=UPI002586EA39|nr:hypothetical protein [uncultured Alteromonas sp.]